MSEQEQELAALMANTFLQSTHEERVKHGTWALIARAVVKAGRADAKVARVEALAARAKATAIGPNPFVLAADIDTALAEPERDHVAEADEIRKQRQG